MNTACIRGRYREDGQLYILSCVILVNHVSVNAVAYEKHIEEMNTCS